MKPSRVKTIEKYRNEIVKNPVTNICPHCKTEWTVDNCEIDFETKFVHSILCYFNKVLCLICGKESESQSII